MKTCKTQVSFRKNPDGPEWPLPCLTLMWFSIQKAIQTTVNFSQKSRDQSNMYKYVQLFPSDSNCTSRKNLMNHKNHIGSIQGRSRGHMMWGAQRTIGTGHVPKGWQLSDKGLSDVCQLSNEQIVGDWSDINLIITNSSHLTLIQPILRHRNFRT